MDTHFNDKMTHLAYKYVTMKELMDTFYEKTDLSDVICENCSKIYGKMSKSEFEKHQSVLKAPMQLRMFFQRSEYNSVRYEYWKNKSKVALPSQYSMSFSGSHDEVFYILVSIKLHVGKYMDISHYACDVLDYNTGKLFLLRVSRECLRWFITWKWTKKGGNQYEWIR